MVGKNREPRIPDVPTVRELGMLALEVCTNWVGLHAPALTPDPVIKVLSETTVAYQKTQVSQQKLAEMGMRSMGDSPDAFKARIAKDYALFGEVARKAHIQKS